MATPSVSMITKVIQSWEQVKLTPNVEEAVGQLVFGKFFDLAPSAMDLYPFFCASHEELFHDSSFRAHSTKVIQTLDYVITSLMDIDKNILIKLGFRHSKYPGVSPEFFHPLGPALIHALKTLLEPNWYPALEEAWVNVIDFLAQSMSEGIQKGSNAKATVRRHLPPLSLDSEPLLAKKESPTRSVSPTESDSCCHESFNSDGLRNDEKRGTCFMSSQRKMSTQMKREVRSKHRVGHKARPFELKEHEVEVLQLSWGAFNTKAEIAKLQKLVLKRYKAGIYDGNRRGGCFFTPALGPKCQPATMISKVIVDCSAEAVDTAVEMGKRHITHYSSSDDLMRDLPILGEVFHKVLKEELEKKNFWSVDVQLVWNKFLNGLVASMMNGVQQVSVDLKKNPMLVATRHG